MTLKQTTAPFPQDDRRVDCRVIQTVDELEPYEGEWDRLAVACGKPTCRPAWLRAWWEASVPPADQDARALRVAMVRADERLVGVFPCFLVDRNSSLPELRLLGQPALWSVEPLMSRDAPAEMLAAAARTLSETAPRAARVVLGFAPTDARWPSELGRQWPGGPAWLRRGRAAKLFVIQGPMPFEAWVASRSRPWRTEYRRLTRRRAEAGLETRCDDDPDRVEDDVRALARLHQARWEWQSNWMSQGVERAIAEAVRVLGGSGDVRVWKIVRGEKMVGGALFARAGDVSDVLLTAFDPAWGSLGPGLGAVIAGVQHELNTGVRLIDFGDGGFKFIQRLTTAVQPVTSYELFPCHRRMPAARARWLVPHARERVNIWRIQLRLGRRLRARLGG